METAQTPLDVDSLSLEDQLIVKSIKSFSTRWGRMSPLLVKNLGQKSTPGVITAAQGRLEKLHLDAIGKLLPLLGKDERSALVGEIIAVDGKLLDEFLQDDEMIIDKAKEIMWGKLVPQQSVN